METGPLDASDARVLWFAERVCASLGCDVRAFHSLVASDGEMKSRIEAYVRGECRVKNEPRAGATDPAPRLVPTALPTYPSPRAIRETRRARGASDPDPTTPLPPGTGESEALVVYAEPPARSSPPTPRLEPEPGAAAETSDATANGRPSSPRRVLRRDERRGEPSADGRGAADAATDANEEGNRNDPGGRIGIGSGPGDAAPPVENDPPSDEPTTRETEPEGRGTTRRTPPPVPRSRRTRRRTRRRRMRRIRRGGGPRRRSRHGDAPRVASPTTPDEQPAAGDDAEAPAPMPASPPDRSTRARCRAGGRARVAVPAAALRRARVFLFEGFPLRRASSSAGVASSACSSRHLTRSARTRGPLAGVPHRARARTRRRGTRDNLCGASRRREQMRRGCHGGRVALVSMSRSGTLEDRGVRLTEPIGVHGTSGSWGRRWARGGLVGCDRGDDARRSGADGRRRGPARRDRRAGARGTRRRASLHEQLTTASAQRAVEVCRVAPNVGGSTVPRFDELTRQLTRAAEGRRITSEVPHPSSATSRPSRSTSSRTTAGARSRWSSTRSRR